MKTRPLVLLALGIIAVASAPEGSAASAPSVIALAPPSLYTYEILLDTDSNAATGGSVTLTKAGGTIVMPGVDRRVVVTADVALHRVTQTAVLQWNGTTFVQTSVDNTQYPLSTTPAAVEFGALRSALGSPTGPITARFHATLASGLASDYTKSFVFDSRDGSAFLADVPTLGPWGFVVLTSILALIGAVLARNGRAIAWVLAGAAILMAATAWAATIIMDGNLSDWAGISAIVTEPPGGSSIGDPNEDITAGYVTADASRLYFRMDFVGVSGPTPTPTPTPTVTPTATPTATPPSAQVTLDPVPGQTIPTNTTLSLRLSGHSTSVLSALTYGLVAGPAGASVTPLGVFNFAPSQSQLGAQTVTARVQDQGGHSAQTTFQVNVVDHDHPPVLGKLSDDLTRVGASYTKVLTATDPDAGDVLTFSLLSGPAGMTLTGSTLSWTPTSAQLGDWPVRVKVTDRAGLSDSGLFHVGIQFLVATDDAYQVNLGKTLTVAAPGVLGNDLDPLAGPLTASKLTNPDKGTLNSFNSDGTFVYQAPAVVDPVFSPVVRYHVDSVGYSDPPLVADVDGDGKPELIFLGFGGGASAGITAVRGTDGSVLWHTPALPAPYSDCTAGMLTGGGLYHLAIGDIDDSGQLSIVFPTSCGRDNQPTGIVGSSTARYMALNARDGTVKWLSPPLSRELDGAGNPDGLAGGTVPTLARVRSGETPSIVVGLDASYFLFNGKPECDQLVPGWPVNVMCRGVIVLDGKDGAVRQRMAAPTAAEFDTTAYGNGFQAAVVADLDGDGNVEFVFGGGVFNNDGSVRSNNNSDGTGYSLPLWSGLGNFDDTPDIEVARLERSPAGSGGGYRLAVYKSDGRLLWSLPLPATGYTGLPVVADVDGSGRPAIVFNVDGNVCAIDYRGNYKWCHDVGALGGISNISIGSRVQVYDLDGDGVPEAIVQVDGEILLFLDGKTGNVKYSLDMNSTHLPQFLDTGVGGPVLADVDGSGHASIVTLWGGAGRLDVVGSATNDWRPVRKIFNQESYQFGNIKDDGTMPKFFVNNFATPATNVFGTQPQVLTPVDPRKKVTTSFTYAASDGPLTSAPGTVTIEILPPNRPPVFVSTPPTRHLVNSPFAYAAQAIDPDPGDTVTYSLKLAQGNGGGSFGNCTIDASSGLLSCGILFSGEQDFVIVATDSLGAAAYQTIKMLDSAGPAAVPNVVGQLQAAAGTTLTGAGFTTGNITQIDNPAPAGQVIQQNPGAGTLALLGSSVDLVVSKGPPPPPPPPGPPPGLGNIKRIVVTPASTLHIVGENVPYTATAIYNDNTGADITAFAVWSSSATAVATVNTAGVAHAVAPGATVLTATAGGLSGQASLGVAARANGDNTPPTAIITQPASGGTVTGLTQILGTATDAHFLRYELALEASGDTTFTQFGQGTTQVTNGVLGTLDPTLLLNGAYTLQLKVYDANGNNSTAQVQIVLEGSMKVGHFTVTYTDLTVRLAGVPIQVIRTYDSRDKRTGDFGVGWSLSLKTLRFSESGVPGTGWQVVKQGLSYVLVPGADHFVSVTLPNGDVGTFDLVVTPSSSVLIPFSTLQASFVPRPGTLGTLTSLDNTNLLIVDPQPGPVTLVDDATLSTFHPDRFLYMQLDGKQIVVTRTHGVESVKDTNGNQVTISASGITHSSGASVPFSRDANGRITGITDPNGHTQTYAYSASGDQVSHTDAAGNTTTYFYNAQHDLVRIVDPLGHPVARAEFDDDGRLISMTDALGHTTTYQHDLPGRQEQIVDALGSPTLLTYDERGNVLSQTDATGQVSNFTYDSRNNQLSQTEPLGRVATKTFDAQNNVLTSTSFDGNTTISSYDARGHVLTTLDAEGRMTTNAYDASGNLTRVTDPEGGVTQHTYDAAGNRLTTTDPFGHVTTFTYDPQGRLLASRDPLGHTTTYTYDALGNRLTATDPLGKTTANTYDALGRVTVVTDPLGNKTGFTYSNQGNGQRLLSRTDPNGNVSLTDYDDAGNPITVTLPDGSVQSITYDLDNRPVTKSNGAGATTTIQYDALGRIAAITDPYGGTLQLTYDAAGRLATWTNERGKVTTFAWSPNQRTITDPLGHTTVDDFDSHGLRVKRTDALGRVTTFAYDGLGNLTRTTFPDGSFRSSTYDASGRLIASTDQAGRTTQFSYDAAGHLLSVTDAAGRVTSHSYDLAGNRVTQTDANGHTTQTAYDAMGRVVTRTLPSGKTETFAYDANGNNVSHTDFNGQTTAYVFDTMNRLTRKDLPGGSTVPFAYTASGLRRQAGGDRYAYDLLDRLVQERKTSGEIVSYTYDAAGNQTSLTSPAGTTTYAYDALDRVASVVDATGTTLFAYNAIGNIASAIYPNGVTATYGHDTLDRLASVTNNGPAGLISSYAYTLGPNGNRLQAVEAGPGTAGRTVNYSYDPTYRLLQEHVSDPGSPDMTIDYSYDSAGNRTQMTRNGVATTYGYDSNDRLISEASGVGTITSSYDDNGNLTVRSNGSSNTVYSYDAENHLLGVANPGGAISYAYDADGLRIGKLSGGVNSTYLLDKNRPLAQVLRETAGATSTVYSYGYNGLLGQTGSGTGTHFSLTDGQLSVRQLTDAVGAVTDRYDYDAFGVTLAAAGSTPNAYLYDGERNDADAGLYYLRARYYDQARGRFLSRDPRPGDPARPSSMHRYLYAEADPVNNADPSGLDIYITKEPVNSARELGTFFFWHWNLFVDEADGGVSVLSFGPTNTAALPWWKVSIIAFISVWDDTGKASLGSMTKTEKEKFLRQNGLAYWGGLYYLETTQEEDDYARAQLPFMTGAFPYALLTTNCRFFAEESYDILVSKVERYRIVKTQRRGSVGSVLSGSVIDSEAPGAFNPLLNITF